MLFELLNKQKYWKINSEKYFPHFLFEKYFYFFFLKFSDIFRIASCCANICVENEINQKVDAKVCRAGDGGENLFCKMLLWLTEYVSS
jgi:hypothetical protein